MVMTNYKLCKWKIRVLKNCILVGKYQILQTKKYKVFLNHKIVYSKKNYIKILKIYLIDLMTTQAPSKHTGKQKSSSASF